jgi:polyhydroxyalkanoate synthesis regulator phasin
VTENEGLRRYLKAGMTFSDLTRARADELLHELIKTGETERHKVQDRVGDLVRTGRNRSGAFISTVSGEFRKPLNALGRTKVHDPAKKGDAIQSDLSPAPRETTGRTIKGAAVKMPSPDKAPGKIETSGKIAAQRASSKKSAKKAGA